MLQEKYVQSITTAKSELTGRIKGRTVTNSSSFSSKGEKRSEKGSAFLMKLCKTKSCMILFEIPKLSSKGQNALLDSVLGKFYLYFLSKYEIHKLSYC